MKYFGKILLGLALLSGVFLQAEEAYDMDWVSQFGTYGADWGYSITIDEDDNQFVTGYIYKGSDGSRDAFISKYDSEGNQVWVREFGTSENDWGLSITIDKSGNLFIAGRTSGTFVGETSSGRNDAFVAKFDSEGKQVWVKQFGTSGSDDGYSITIDESGNLYVSGRTYGTFPGETSSGGYYDAFVAKFDSEGKQVWVKQFGTSGFELGYSIAVNKNGNLFITGNVSRTFPGETSSGGTDAYIAKYDSEGNQIWIRQFGTSRTDTGRSIATDESGNLFITGNTMGTFPGETSSGYEDVFVAKYDSEGNQIWVKQFGTSHDDWGFSIATDGNGNLFIAGRTGSGETSSSNRNAFITKYDSDGNQIWVKQFGTSSFDEGYSIAIDGSGNPFVFGNTGGTFPGETSSGGWDVFIAKFRSNEANTIPVADAGEDQSSVVGDIVQLDGSGSSDADSDPLVFSWSLTKPEESSAKILDPTSDLTSFIPDVPGTYTASLIVNDGFADSELDTTKIVVVSVSTAITEIINETIDAIDTMPNDSFRNPNRRKALINKLNATLKMVDDGEYQEALDKLQSDILQKIDGCTLRGKPDKQDWIIDCENQEEVYDLIIKAISRLESLI